jgi:hypothetical protein
VLVGIDRLRDMIFDGLDGDCTLDQASLALGLDVGDWCRPASGQSQRDDRKQEGDLRSVECLGPHREIQIESASCVDSSDMRSPRALGGYRLIDGPSVCHRACSRSASGSLQCPTSCPTANAPLPPLPRAALTLSVTPQARARYRALMPEVGERSLSRTPLIPPSRTLLGDDPSEPLTTNANRPVIDGQVSVTAGRSSPELAVPRSASPSIRGWQPSPS